MWLALLPLKVKKLEEIIEGRPQALIHKGKLFEDVMNEAKLTRHELDATLRQSGYFEIKDVKLAILENNGSVTVQGYEQT